MAGKIVTKEDLEDGGFKDTFSEATPSDKSIPSDQKFDQNGKEMADEEPSEDASIEEKDGKESLSKPLDEFKPKHKSWEETESARATLEREFHTKSGENAELKRRLAALEKPPEKKVADEDEISKITDETLKEMDNLRYEYGSDGKPTPESIRKVDRDKAIIWNRGQEKIADLVYEKRSRKATSEHDVITKTYNRAQKEGLKSDAELRILGAEYSRTDSSLGVDERIEAAIEATKGIVSSLREGLVKDQKKDKEEKDNLRVLGRGSNRGKETTDTTPKKPSTMADDLAELNKKRTMTKDDLR